MATRRKVPPAEEVKEELEEKGEYVSPIREAETYPGPVEEPPVEVDLTAAAGEIFADDLLDEDQALQAIGPPSYTQPLGIVERLIEIMGEIDAVGKKGTNAAQGYKYQRAVDVFLAVRPEFAKRGLLFVTEVLNTRTTLIERPNKTPNVLVEIECNFRVMDGREVLEFSGAGAGIDASGDKSVYKAITGAMKYGIRQLLMLPDENDPEVARPGEKNDIEGGSITITPAHADGVIQGGRQSRATTAQLNNIRESANALGLSPTTLKGVIASTLGMAPDEDRAPEIMDWLATLSFAECGKVAKVLWDRRQSEVTDAESEES